MIRALGSASQNYAHTERVDQYVSTNLFLVSRHAWPIHLRLSNPPLERKQSGASVPLAIFLIRKPEACATLIPPRALEQWLPPGLMINVPLNCFQQGVLEDALRFPL
jgi:hypothetical protein